MRKRNFGNSNAVLDFFVSFNVGQAVAVRRVPTCSPYGEDRTSRR
jgi:hypothetical protein